MILCTPSKSRNFPAVCSLHFSTYIRSSQRNNTKKSQFRQFNNQHTGHLQYLIIRLINRFI